MKDIMTDEARVVVVDDLQDETESLAMLLHYLHKPVDLEAFRRVLPPL